MNKGELIEKVKATLGGDTSKAAAERAVEAVLEAIKAGIKTDVVSPKLLPNYTNQKSI